MSFIHGFPRPKRGYERRYKARLIRPTATPCRTRAGCATCGWRKFQLRHHRRGPHRHYLAQMRTQAKRDRMHPRPEALGNWMTTISLPRTGVLRQSLTCTNGMRARRPPPRTTPHHPMTGKRTRRADGPVNGWEARTTTAKDAPDDFDHNSRASAGGGWLTKAKTKPSQHCRHHRLRLTEPCPGPGATAFLDTHLQQVPNVGG